MQIDKRSALQDFPLVNVMETVKERRMGNYSHKLEAQSLGNSRIREKSLFASSSYGLDHVRHSQFLSTMPRTKRRGENRGRGGQGKGGEGRGRGREGRGGDN